MRPKAKSSKIKRLHNQLNKVADQSSTKYSKTLKREIPTRRGRVERRIKTLEKTKE